MKAKLNINSTLNSYFFKNLHQISTLVSLIERGGNRRGCSHRQFLIEGGVRIEGVRSFRLVFNKKRVLIEGVCMSAAFQ